MQLLSNWKLADVIVSDGKMVVNDESGKVRGKCSLRYTAIISQEGQRKSNKYLIG
jgi:hypothetical protein